MSQCSSLAARWHNTNNSALRLRLRLRLPRPSLMLNGLSQSSVIVDPAPTKHSSADMRRIRKKEG
jgi:hypothetical protein